jgi:hypothetical protein
VAFIVYNPRAKERAMVVRCLTSKENQMRKLLAICLLLVAFTYPVMADGNIENPVVNPGNIENPVTAPGNIENPVSVMISGVLNTLSILG